MQTNRVILTARPAAGEELSSKHYSVDSVPVPAVRHGEVRVRVTHFSCDPTQRIWATDVKQYMPPVALGEPMRAGFFGVVEESQAEGFSVGDAVTGLGAWCEYLVRSPLEAGWTRLPAGTTAEQALAACGMTTFTAYFGLMDLGRPKAGDAVLVSGAAGATGSFVVQFAKLAGCYVVGIAGGAEKCAYVTSLGADAVIDYKAESVSARVAALGEARGGFDIYFDNTGGEALTAALDNLALHARVVLCGAIASYNQLGDALPGPSNYLNILHRRATMHGLLILDFFGKIPEAMPRVQRWFAEGKLRYKADVQEAPIEDAFVVVNRLFTGKNDGKQIHKLAGQ
eukprot:CAMPEP_0177651226 /NCGR_PEP_ID=MMETSP0447-20121125/12416_1 /TAXON_ID=0 /ORGANISM="Stygamoeba regulata, Strain BSH-02190019" /LENGTH=340 /DNA_ID=CAMNT_0019154255 /DNA_START=121 /DNA_END=1143 /DNA_ORIENTATION=-